MPRRTPDILFLTQAGPTLPSVRFRVLPYVELGKQRGLAMDWKQIPKTMARRLPFYISLPRVKTLVLQKKLLSTPELLLLKSRCQRLIFDFDDAIWTQHPGSCGSPKRKTATRFNATLGLADLVIAGNEFLAAKARELARHVAILPTPIDTNSYVPPAERTPQLTVGWMGAACNLFFLPPILNALGPLPSGIRLLVVSDKPPPTDLHPALIFERWTPEREIAQLQAMDIGLMPLTDDEYTRGKCGFKLLQYLATGAAAIASPVGFNTQIIEHERTGLLADTPSEWAAAIHRLLSDTTLRTSLASQGRQHVISHFSLHTSAEQLWKML